jgi:hypothetical protein
MKKLYYCLFFILISLCTGLYGDENNIKSQEEEWKAIIAYFPGPPEAVTEDWIFFLFDIEEHFQEDENIYFIGIFAGDKTIVPIGPEDEIYADIDISKFALDTAGYIFAMYNKTPQWTSYMPSYMVIELADQYFYGKMNE